MRKDEELVQQSINLFSRVLAMLFLVASPAIGGALLDQKLGGHVFAPMGFGIGMMFLGLGLWVFVKRAGKPIWIPATPIDKSKLVEIEDEPEQSEDGESHAN